MKTPWGAYDCELWMWMMTCYQYYHYKNWKLKHGPLGCVEKGCQDLYYWMNFLKDLWEENLKGRHLLLEQERVKNSQVGYLKQRRE